jgi:hypothetical protein
VRQVGQCTQPVDDGAGAPAGKGAELLADARPLEDWPGELGCGVGAVHAEERREENREARVPHPPGEPRDVRADAGHLGHDDDSRAGAGDVHSPRVAAILEAAGIEVGERVAWSVSCGHGRTIRDRSDV